mmetsp:Transcript_20548/g.31393  ORF Transcript_20548/g.31393 Transcript_20548/m.31393 type:complete len:1253 (+) Transcript_20548:246-4004(+)
MTSTAPRIPTFKRRVSYHTNSSTSFKKKIPKVQEKPAKFATIAHLTLQQCIKHYDGELRDLLAPPSTHARAIMGEDGGLELEHDDLSSGDEDDENNNNNNVEDTEPLWTRGNTNESSHVSNSTLKPAALPFGRRKIALFDMVTPEHRHEARDVIRSILKSDCSNSGVLRANIRQALAQHLSLGSNHDTVEDVVALGSALLTETLTANKYESMEGLGKCYAGLMDAGRGVLATKNAETNNNNNSNNNEDQNGNGNTNTASTNTNPSSSKAHTHTMMDDTKNILRSIEVLCLTQLTKATGDALHTLGQLYSMCGTARYQRRMVQRIGPLLLRPPYSAPYSVQHIRDMEPILVVTEIILRHSHSIFGDGWYARGQAIREDEARMHTIQAAASYLQNLPVYSMCGNKADGKHMMMGSNSAPLGGGSNHHPLNGSSEVQKLDMLIRSTVMGVSRGMCSYSLTYGNNSLGHGSSHHGLPMLQSVGSAGGMSTGGGGNGGSGNGGGAYSNKKCPLSPRVNKPPVAAAASTNTANATANAVVEVQMPSVTPAPVSIISTTVTATTTTNTGEVSPTQQQQQTSNTATTNAAAQQYPTAPLTPKPSIPQYVLHDTNTNYSTPRSPGSPPKSPYYYHNTSTSRTAKHNANWMHTQQNNRLLLDGMERLRTVMACRALRQQITAYEDRFEQMYRRKVKKPADKAPLASTYAQYREWKRVIRSDAARRIQALGRGYCCRRTLLEAAPDDDDDEEHAAALKALIKRNNYHAAAALALRNKFTTSSSGMPHNKVPVVMTLPVVSTTDVLYGAGAAHNVGVEVVVQPGLPQPRSSSGGHHHHGGGSGGGVFMNTQQQHLGGNMVHRSQMQQYSQQQRLLVSQQQQQQQQGSHHQHPQLHTSNNHNNVMVQQQQNHHHHHPAAAAHSNAAHVVHHNNNSNNNNNNISSSRAAAYNNRRLNARQPQQQQHPTQQQQQPYHPSTAAYNVQQQHPHNHNAAAVAAAMEHHHPQNHTYSNNNNSRHSGGGNSAPSPNHPHHPHHHRHHHSNEASIGSNDSSDDSSSGFSRSRGIKELLRQKRELKAQLKQYDNNFKRQHGRMPVKAEKEPIRHLYETYNTLKAKIAMLEAGGDVGNVNIPSSYEGSPSSLSGHRSPRTLTPPPPLNINTGVGVGVGVGGSSGSVGSMSGNTSPNTISSYGSNVQDMAALRQEKGHLHQMLRTYEKDFYQAHGRQVSSYEDIRPVAQQYRRYKEIKHAINALQEEERSLGRTSL